MKVLALETSGRVGSVALLEGAGGDAVVLAEKQLPPAERTAQSLLPCIRDVLSAYSWRPADIELVATTTGPGSFTGLRIGVVAAKTFAYATGARLVGVHTLAALAAGSGMQSGRLWTVLDAQRQELFAAQFDATRPIVEQHPPATAILGIKDWLDQLKSGDAVAGPPLAQLRGDLPAGVTQVDQVRWAPSAAALGRLALELFERGEQTPPLELVPQYFRKSAAEEKAGGRSGSTP